MGIQVQRILVPMDFSDYSRQALTFANNLAKDLDSEVELVHVVETSPYEVYQKRGFVHSVPVYARAGTGIPRAAENYIIHDVLEDARNQLLTLAGETVKHRVEVRQGRVVDELLEEIEAYRPHLVVMCTHGWSGIKHLVLGSVVEKMVHLSPSPVLTIRAVGG